MDFMNFMSQINNCGMGCGSCGFDNNIYQSYNRNNCGIGLLPLLLLSGLGQTNNQCSNMVCYPNQAQQVITPTSTPYYDNGLKYKTRKVKQAYMEVPVATYQVAQPYYNQSYPTNMNIVPVGGNRNGSFDICTLLLLLFLIGRSNNGCTTVCTPTPQARTCSATEI